MKARYLTFFSYIGTSFRAAEKLWFRGGKKYPDPDSIQGLMELALLKFKSLNYPSITLSSRTDGGVHALQTSAHFDLEQYGGSVVHPNTITYRLNRFFYENKRAIYVNKCIRVDNNFNARYNTISRTYLYRLAILKNNATIPEKAMIASYIPIEEWKRCHFKRLPGYDIEKFREGAKYLEGYHDFTTFKKFDKLHQHKHNRRSIQSIEVRPGRPLLTSYAGPREDFFDYWDIEIRGRAFVHNQIRRMLGTLVSVAIGKIPPEEVKLMLQVPSKHSWHNFIQCLPPEGLYLCNVEYRPEDLVFHPEKEVEVTEDREEEDCDSDSE